VTALPGTNGVKTSQRWYSSRLETDVHLVRWGHWGTPVLIFPTAGGDAEEIERFHLVGSVWPLVEAGRIKIYSVDSIAGRAWLSPEVSRARCCWLQNRYDACIHEQVVPAIRADCGGSDVEIVVAGASIGAFNAVATLCRHPEVFRLAIAMSGTYDLERFLDGHFEQDFYFSSPLHYLPGLEDGAQLAALRRRFVLLAYAQGRWEDPRETWRLAEVLGAKGVPNRVDPWGTEFDHDWPTWRTMLPHYLEELVP
jgi:esterase/lipase superfamily enzyme